LPGALIAGLERTPNDQIIPARFFGESRDRQVQGLFRDLRYDTERRLRPDFALNQPAFANARIVVAERNFGCGSSREPAVTVMVDNGFRAFIAPSFGDIFFNNCFQNGVLPIRLDAARVATIRTALHVAPGAFLTIDLANQTVVGPDGQTDRFEIDSFRKDWPSQGCRRNQSHARLQAGDRLLRGAPAPGAELAVNWPGVGR